MPRRSIRKLLAIAVTVNLLGVVAPGASVAGDNVKLKPAKCDPSVQVCDNGRKNG